MEDKGVFDVPGVSTVECEQQRVSFCK